MSTTGSIDILIHSADKQNANVFDALLAGGWTASDFGNVTYMVSGEEYEWTAGPQHRFHYVLNQLKEQSARLLPSGIVFTWEDSHCGGEFIIFPNRMLSVALTINRRTLDSTCWTDYSWYLTRIIDSLEREGFQIERITCQDC